MAEAAQLILAYMASGRDEEVKSLASGIDTGNFTLLSVVQGLGEYLTSEEPSKRIKGVALLSDVIVRCNPERMSAQSTKVMTSFLRGKLEESETVEPALLGLEHLANLPTFSDDCAVETVNSILANVRMKSHAQTTRFVVYKIIDKIMSSHRLSLKSIGPNFVAGYASLAEGEKDPRNLIISFAIVRILLIEFDSSAQIDNLFDITFCYFPITFAPPPGDPYGISTEDLKLALRECLGSSPAFGPLALPLFLDKLSASTGNPKRDTLQTLEYCLPVYGRAVAIEYAVRLWDSFRIEIFQPIDSETEALALKASQSLIRTLYPRPQAGGLPKLDGLVVSIVQECKKVLREPEKSQAQHAIKVLGAFVETTPEIRQYTLSESIQHLLDLYRNPDEVSYRSPILAGIVGIIMAVNQAEKHYPAERALDPYKDTIMGALTSGLKVSNCQRPALEGLYNLVLIKGLLTSAELGYLTHNINEILTDSTPDFDELRPSILKALCAISEVDSRSIIDTTLPLLFQSLPDAGPSRDAPEAQAKYRYQLESLTALCSPPTLFEILVIRLSSKLDLLSRPNRHSPDVECDAAYAYAILQTLHKILLKKVEEKHVDVPKYVDSLGESLLWLFIRGATSSLPETPKITSNERVIGVAGNILSLLGRVTSAERQSTFAAALFSAFKDGDLSKLCPGRKLGTETILFAPFAPNAPSSQKALIPLFTAPLTSIRRDVIPVADTSSALTELVQWTLDSADGEYQLSAILHLIASILNKRLQDAAHFLENSVPALWNAEIGSINVLHNRRRRALRIYTWIVKALLVRNHPDLNHHIDRYFSAFSDGQIAWDAANGLGELGRGGENVLTKQNFAVLSLLHIQKFSNGTLPRILVGCKLAASPVQQTNYLIALAALLKSIPKSLYQHELSGMMPFLLRGVDLPDEEMRTGIVNILISIVEDPSAAVSEIIDEHALNIVASMLRSIDYRTTSSPQLRAAALRSLGMFPTAVRYSMLHPQKNIVIAKLAKALDDPKRVVRKEAVDARHNWFALAG